MDVSTPGPGGLLDRTDPLLPTAVVGTGTLTGPESQQSGSGAGPIAPQLNFFTRSGLRSESVSRPLIGQLSSILLSHGLKLIPSLPPCLHQQWASQISTTADLATS